MTTKVNDYLIKRAAKTNKPSEYLELSKQLISLMEKLHVKKGEHFDDDILIKEFEKEHPQLENNLTKITHNV